VDIPALGVCAVLSGRGGRGAEPRVFQARVGHLRPDCGGFPFRPLHLPSLLKSHPELTNTAIGQLCFTLGVHGISYAQG
jgi:hypothetical protein